MLNDLALVANGEILDRNTASGVPYGLYNAIRTVSSSLQVQLINATPLRLWRWVARTATFNSNRVQWDGNYINSVELAAMRSMRRNELLRRSYRSEKLDHILHIRSWYLPINGIPYSAFIDATGEMLRDTSPEWTYTKRVHRMHFQAEQRYFENASYIFVASRAAARSLVTEYNVNDKNVIYVGNGKNVETNWRPTDEDVVRRFHKRNIMFVGKDAKRKGLDILIDACKELHHHGYNFKLTVVGPNPSPQFTYPSFIDWIGTVDHYSELGKLFRDASLICLPSRHEPFGIAVPEGMSFSLPAIVSSEGELPSIVRDRSDGVVIDAPNSQSLASAIRYVFEDLDRYRTLTQNAQYRSELFTWNHVASKILDTIRGE